MLYAHHLNVHHGNITFCHITRMCLFLGDNSSHFRVSWHMRKYQPWNTDQLTFEDHVRLLELFCWLLERTTP